jgi:fucose 4-O-acetylase-like acetyltransferase
MFLVFIEVGYELAKSNLKSFGLPINTALFGIFCIGYYFISRKLPSITSDPYLPIVDILPHFIMACCGSLMLIELSKKIGTNTFFEQFGKHSLVIYCLHFQFMFSFYQIFKEQLNTMNVHYTISALIILYIFTAYGCLYCSKLLNTKYLKWILGKF